MQTPSSERRRPPGLQAPRLARAPFPQVCYNKTLLRPRAEVLGRWRRDPQLEPPQIPQVIIIGPGGHPEVQHPCLAASAPLGRGELPWPFRLDPHSLLCPQSARGLAMGSGGTPRLALTPPRHPGCLVGPGLRLQAPFKAGEPDTTLPQTPGARGLRAGEVMEPELSACTSGQLCPQQALQSPQVSSLRNALAAARLGGRWMKPTMVGLATGGGGRLGAATVPCGTS